jgi:uncharacterized protein YrrD
MLTTKEVRNVKVCRPAKPGKEHTKDGMPRHRRRIGKVYKTVFSPSGLKVVGFIVRQPDLLWMFKRPERFLALDAYDVQEGVIVPTKGVASWDEKAIERLGVDFDKCILWEGIQVRTRQGKDLGAVDDISFDERTGELNSFFMDDGMTARALVGTIEIPAELVVGYKKGILVVENEAADLLPQGGLAARAGEASAKAGQAAKEAGKKVDDAASEAVDKGTRGLGKAIGKTKRAAAAAVDEYREESGANERKAGSSSKGSAKKKGAKTSSKGVGEAVNDHMKGVGSMFGDFKKEFDKARK